MHLGSVLLSLYSYPKRVHTHLHCKSRQKKTPECKMGVERLNLFPMHPDPQILTILELSPNVANFLTSRIPSMYPYALSQNRSTGLSSGDFRLMHHVEKVLPLHPTPRNIGN